MPIYIQLSPKLTEESYQKELSSFSTSLEDARSRYRENLKHIKEQDEKALRLAQSDISTFEGHVSTLEETIRMSKTDEERLRQLDADLEIKKRGLRDFELSF
ncbi:hypothetical protein LIER_42255 [Lithospermum erythrorhizon]|uniref:Uncharacterized protein n=1 Tax=Lithospermum erythrorhizon TaxID=34254 RepID=A0AAV3RQ40_LITER